jgi:hypothetical protein
MRLFGPPTPFSPHRNHGPPPEIPTVTIRDLCIAVGPQVPCVSADGAGGVSAGGGGMGSDSPTPGSGISTEPLTFERGFNTLLRIHQGVQKGPYNSPGGSKGSLKCTGGAPTRRKPRVCG